MIIEIKKPTASNEEILMLCCQGEILLTTHAAQ